MLARRLKVIGLVILAVAAAASGLGLLAFRGDARPAGTPASAEAKKAGDASATAVRGTVVDAGGRPVARAVVEARAGGSSRETATDELGRFELQVPDRWLRGLLVVASRQGGREQAFWQSWGNPQWRKGQSLRLQLKAARRVEVRVVDGAGEAVTTARVGVVASSAGFAATTTDAAGKVTCLFPADAPLSAVYAWKGGKGLDYKRAAPPDGGVVLTLSGAAPVRVRVLDPEGKPVAQLPVYPWYLKKPGEPGDLNLSLIHSEAAVKTDRQGVARFDWIPAWEKGTITFWAHSDAYAGVRQLYDPKTGGGTLQVKLDRVVPIRGRVLFPDGKPAANIRVEANGKGYTFDEFRGNALTDADGRFEMRAYPNQVYLVVVNDGKWSAPPHTGFAVWPDRPVTGLDFHLRPATRVHGRVTLGPAKEPVAGQWMSLYQYGTDAHSLKGAELPNPENSNLYVQPIIVRTTKTGKDGSYEFFLGPGKYDLRGPNQTELKNFTIRDEKAVVYDFHAPRPEQGRLTGQVVTGDPPRPVAGAEVWGIYRHELQPADLQFKSGKDGYFDVARALHRTVLYVRTADRGLVGVVEIKEDDMAVTIPVRPAGSARGRLVDENGTPLGGKEVVYGVKVHLGDEKSPFRSSFGGRVQTDKDGHFLLSGLVVGQLYHVNVTVEKDSWRGVGQVRAKDATPVELGDLKLSIPEKPLTLEERIAAAFAPKLSPRKRFAAAVADARLADQRVLVLFADPASAATRQFFHLRHEDEDASRGFDPYRIVPVSVGKKAPADAGELAKQLNVQLEKRSFPLLLVYDTDYAQVAALEAGRIDRDRMLQFLKAHAPGALDARKLLADALAQAKKEKKRVLVQETATWCGPCWALSRFLDRHRDLWSKDYLWVKIDRRWTHADDVMNGIRKGYRGGIPWTAILDADGKVLATSNDAKGENIGFPSTPPGIEHFSSMIQKTRMRLTDAEVVKFRTALEAP